MELRSSITPDLFLGLVTHSKSKYSIDMLLSAILNYQKESAKKPVLNTAIFSKNIYDINEVNILHVILNFINFQILTFRWRRYLGIKSNKFSFFKSVFKIIKFTGQLVFTKLRKKHKNSALRILNINKSHYHLLELGLNSGAKSLLILEDDADIVSLDIFEDCIYILHEFSEKIINRLFYIDISESFTLEQLGASHLVDESSSQVINLGSEVYRIQKMTRPITNTVCAVYYSEDLARLLLNRLNKEMPKVFNKFIPIDWLMNKILIDLNKQSIVIDCFTTNPGLFTQRSLHK